MTKALLFLTLLIWNPYSIFSQSDTNILVHADQMPYFSGCTDYQKESMEKRQCSERRLVEFISEHLVYPESAKKEEVEGTVIISFVIDEEGKVETPYILRDIGGGCGEAALDVINHMPVWEPAIHEGAAVKVKLNLPIQFYFKDDLDQLTGGYQISWGRMVGEQISQETLNKNLDAKVWVRDQYGNDILINELVFSVSRKRKYREERSSGSVTKDMKRLVRKAKKGSIFAITAAVQKEGKFVYIDKEYRIID